MPRPPKTRTVEFTPDILYFSPEGRQGVEEIFLSVEEWEAFRLKDYKGLHQEEGARRMRVSRPTFRRILISARSKIAEALVLGKALRIGGGSYKIDRRGRGRHRHGHGHPPNQ